jgi:predicted pyridoxine 5'-phosphate oxidase superfamily flavin-nucleotide-binding protein
MTDPFHEGERALQLRAGVREQSASIGARMVRDAMPEQHRELFARLPFVLIGSVDAEARAQASLLAGAPGFVRAPDARTLAVDALPDAADPLAAGLRPGAAVGLLGIEPHTRRRNRVNGVIGTVSATGFTVRVQQSFGNCPKYIQARRAHFAGRADPGPAEAAQRIDAADEALIASADTFYLASAYPAQGGDVVASHGVDVSHRGGKPGFVRVERGAIDTLTVPDFSGNGLFNTLGNLSLNPHAGLLFLDHERGDLLHVACDAEVLWDGAELAAFDGAERLLRLRVRGRLRRPRAVPLRWTAPELSPFLEETGAWPAPAGRR